MNRPGRGVMPGGKRGGGGIVVRAFALMSMHFDTILPFSVGGTCIISLILSIPPFCLLLRLLRSCVDLTTPFPFCVCRTVTPAAHSTRGYIWLTQRVDRAGSTGCSA